MKHFIFLFRSLSLLLIIVIVFSTCRERSTSGDEGNTVYIYPDSILNDLFNHPVGINLDYYMDDDNFLKPERSLAEALKSMGVRYLRYPGGDKSDSYLFSKPPYREADPALTRIGKGCIGGRDYVLNDDYETFNRDVLDFDEFITLCREIEAEPVVVVAADSYLRDYPGHCTVTSRDQLLEHAAAWVRYSNLDNDYAVKYWMIGNESWHDNNENSTAEIYANDVIDFSKRMKAVDSSIYIIPNGSSVEFLDTVLMVAGKYIDHICISNYPIWQYKSGYVTYRDTLQDLLHPVQRAISAMEKNNMPETMKVIVAEYGPFDWASTLEGDHDQSQAWQMNNDMGHALCNFEMTGRQLEKPEVDFSCFWNTRWIYNDSIDYSVYDALDRDGNFNANGYSLMIWGNYLGEKMVKTKGNVHIRPFASTLKGENKIILFLINTAEEIRIANLSIPGKSVQTIRKIGELLSEGPADTDPFWNESADKTIEKSEVLELAGTSITVYEILISTNDSG